MRRGGRTLSLNSDEQSYCNRNRLLVALAERIAVGRLDEPAELPLLRQPEHPVERELGGHLRSLAARGVGEPGTGADHELERIGDRERFLEQEIHPPF